ncbi:hypothetical protein Tco_1403118 [Tanacetum coccineum]
MNKKAARFKNAQFKKVKALDALYRRQSKKTLGPESKAGLQAADQEYAHAEDAYINPYMIEVANGNGIVEKVLCCVDCGDMRMSPRGLRRCSY